MLDSTPFYAEMPIIGTGRVFEVLCVTGYEAGRDQEPRLGARGCDQGKQGQLEHALAIAPGSADPRDQ